MNSNLSGRKLTLLDLRAIECQADLHETGSWDFNLKHSKKS